MNSINNLVLLLFLSFFIPSSAFGNVIVVDHPLIKHKLTLMRKRETSSCELRKLLNEVAMLLTSEATRNLPLSEIEIETPVCETKAPIIAMKKLCFFSNLRAGNGLLEGMLEMVPSTRVAHIGMYRDLKSLLPVEYYFKTPPQIEQKDALVVDPMLATGNTAVNSIQMIKKKSPKSIKFICLVELLKESTGCKKCIPM